MRPGGDLPQIPGLLTHYKIVQGTVQYRVAIQAPAARAAKRERVEIDVGRFADLAQN